MQTTLYVIIDHVYNNAISAVETTVSNRKLMRAAAFIGSGCHILSIYIDIMVLTHAQQRFV